MHVIYKRSPLEPSLPVGGVWDGTTFTPPDGWYSSVPEGTGELYLSIVAFDSETHNILYSPPLLIAGGTQGQHGESVDPASISTGTEDQQVSQWQRIEQWEIVSERSGGQHRLYLDETQLKSTGKPRSIDEVLAEIDEVLESDA